MSVRVVAIVLCHPWCFITEKKLSRDDSRIRHLFDEQNIHVRLDYYRACIAGRPSLFGPVSIQTWSIVCHRIIFIL
jgi:hypothetical protein